MDAAGSDAYQEALTPVIAAKGGRYLVRGGGIDVLEGPNSPGRLLTGFPTMDASPAFYRNA